MKEVELGSDDEGDKKETQTSLGKVRQQHQRQVRRVSKRRRSTLCMRGAHQTRDFPISSSTSRVLHRSPPRFCCFPQGLRRLRHFSVGAPRKQFSISNFPHQLQDAASPLASCRVGGLCSSRQGRHGFNPCAQRVWARLHCRRDQASGAQLSDTRQATSPV